MLALALIAVLAQTATAVPVSSASTIEELKAQLIATAASAAGALAVAAIAYLRAWLRARLADKLSKVVVTGVENSSRSVEAALVGHLGERGMAALEAVGINLDALRDRIVLATKQSVRAVSIDAGTEQKLAPLVAKVTSQRLAVDAEGNTITK